MKAINTVNAPWKSYYFIEKFDRGQWNRALIDRKIPDFCNGFSNKNEPWFMFTSHFTTKTCPFKAGMVQNFDREEWGKISPLITYSFIGKYRTTFFSYLKDDKGIEQTDCLRSQFEIADF